MNTQTASNSRSGSQPNSPVTLVPSNCLPDTLERLKCSVENGLGAYQQAFQIADSLLGCDPPRNAAHEKLPMEGTLDKFADAATDIELVISDIRYQLDRIQRAVGA